RDRCRNVSKQSQAKIFGKPEPATCVEKLLVMFALEPLQLRGPVTRMEATTGARVNLTLVKILAQRFCESCGASVSPRQQRSGRKTVDVDADQAVPESGDRD